MKKNAISLTIALSFSLTSGFAKDKGLFVEIVKPSSETAKVVKPEDKMVYQKVFLSSIEDLKQTKELLLKVKDGKDSLISEFDLKKDYFRTIDVAMNLIDDLIASGREFSDLQKDSKFQDLISILNALRNKSYSPTEGRWEIVTSLGQLAKKDHKPVISLPADISGVQAPELIDEAKLNSELLRSPELLPPHVVCEYAGPKSGYGVKSGLKIRCNDQKLKLKFGAESNSGPFDSRVFRAANFVTPRIDFVPGVEMKYDRDFITEFNSRKPTHLYFTFVGQKVGHVDLNTEKRDAMSYVRELKLKSGETLRDAELEAFKKQFRTGPSEAPTFNEALEQQIDTVTFGSGSVIEDIDAIEAGLWRFDEPVHLQNQSLRVQVILSIWLGNTDLTMNNTRLLIFKSKNEEKKRVYQVLPIFLDVGFGLGVSNKMIRQTSSDIEHMPDVMSKRRGDDQLQFQFISKVPSPMLESLTFDDSVKALQLMCSFSKDSLQQALEQSGIETSIAEIGAKKLINRRNQFMRDLGVEKAFAACRQ